MIRTDSGWGRAASSYVCIGFLFLFISKGLLMLFPATLYAMLCRIYHYRWAMVMKYVKVILSGNVASSFVVMPWAKTYENEQTNERLNERRNRFTRFWTSPSAYTVRSRWLSLASLPIRLYPDSQSRRSTCSCPFSSSQLENNRIKCIQCECGGSV